MQSLGAASIIFTSAILLNIEITWDILWVIYLLFYSFYLYNRFKEIDIDYPTNPERTKHLKTYIRQMPIIFIAVISILMASLIYFSNLKAILLTLLLLFFGLLYTDIFKKFTKKIPLFKNFYIASFFPLSVIFLPVYYSYSVSILIMGGAMFMMFVFLKALMMQLLLDFKDAETDKKAGLRTLSVIWEEEKLFYFLKALTLLTALPIIIALYFGIFPLFSTLLFLTIPFNFYCFYLARKKNYTAYILAGGEFLLWSILISIGKAII